MLGMVHDRQGLAFGLEAGDDLAGVHARLDDLQRHLASDRLLLLGHEDGAHAPFADLLEELVRADHRARSLDQWPRQGQRSGRHGRFDSHGLFRPRDSPLGIVFEPGTFDGAIGDVQRVEDGGCFQEAAGLIQGSEQGVDLVAEVGVATAGALQVRGAIPGRGDLRSPVEDRFHAFSFASHATCLHRQAVDPEDNATCGPELCHDRRAFFKPRFGQIIERAGATSSKGRSSRPARRVRRNRRARREGLFASPDPHGISCYVPIERSPCRRRRSRGDAIPSRRPKDRG